MSTKPEVATENDDTRNEARLSDKDRETQSINEIQVNTLISPPSSTATTENIPALPNAATVDTAQPKVVKVDPVASLHSLALSNDEGSHPGPCAAEKEGIKARQVHVQQQDGNDLGMQGTADVASSSTSSERETVGILMRPGDPVLVDVVGNAAAIRAAGAFSSHEIAAIDTDSGPQDDDGTPINFPQRLMEILSNDKHSDVISWLPHGKGFMIRDKKKFEKEMLPKYFKASKFTSFTRKLNRWNFVRVTRGPESGAYYHPLFQQGNEDWCVRMSCINSKSSQQLQPMNPIALGIQSEDYYNFRGNMMQNDPVAVAQFQEQRQAYMQQHAFMAMGTANQHGATTRNASSSSDHGNGHSGSEGIKADATITSSGSASEPHRSATSSLGTEGGGAGIPTMVAPTQSSTSSGNQVDVAATVNANINAMMAAYHTQYFTMFMAQQQQMAALAACQQAMQQQQQQKLQQDEQERQKDQQQQSDQAEQHRHWQRNQQSQLQQQQIRDNVEQAQLHLQQQYEESQDQREQSRARSHQQTQGFASHHSSQASSQAQVREQLLAAATAAAAGGGFSNEAAELQREMREMKETRDLQADQHQQIQKLQASQHRQLQELQAAQQQQMQTLQAAQQQQQSELQAVQKQHSQSSSVSSSEPGKAGEYLGSQQQPPGTMQSQQQLRSPMNLNNPSMQMQGVSPTSPGGMNPSHHSGNQTPGQWHGGALVGQRNQMQHLSSNQSNQDQQMRQMQSNQNSQGQQMQASQSNTGQQTHQNHYQQLPSSHQNQGHQMQPQGNQQNQGQQMQPQGSEQNQGQQVQEVSQDFTNFMASNQITPQAWNAQFQAHAAAMANAMGFNLGMQFGSFGQATQSQGQPQIQNTQQSGQQSSMFQNNQQSNTTPTNAQGAYAQGGPYSQGTGTSSLTSSSTIQGQQQQRQHPN